MPAPTLQCEINFSSGASFGQTMVLGTGKLGTNVLGDAAAVIVDVSNLVVSATIQRGRNPLTDVFQTGTATITLADDTGAFNPQNLSSPYAGLLLPLRKVVIRAVDNNTGTTYSCFSGYITGYNYQQGQYVGAVSTTTLTCVDAFQLLTLATVSTVAGATFNQLSGARINAILDALGWPSGMRDIDPGLTYLSADPATARTGLQALQTAATSEYGAIYVDRDGNVVFQDRSLVATSVSGTPTDFVDTGAGIRYFNAQFVLNDAQIFNQANVSATGLSTATYKDQTSIDTYFLHSYDINNLLMNTYAEADNYARAYVASRKDTTIRCDAITLDLYSNDYAAGVLAALSLDYFNPITVTQTQPGSSTITKRLQIFGVAHSISYQSWKTTFTTLEPMIDGLILNDPIFGQLDDDVLCY